MFIVRSHLFHQIGAGFQVIQQDLAVVVGGLGVEQLGVLVNLEGHAGEPVSALLVHFDDPQGGFAVVHHRQDGIVLDGGVVGIDVDAVDCSLSYSKIDNSDFTTLYNFFIPFFIQFFRHFT